MTRDSVDGQIDVSEGSGELKADLTSCPEFVAALQDDHMMWTAYNLLIQVEWIRAGGPVKRNWGSNGHIAGFIADLRAKGETYLDIQCYADDGPPFDQEQKWASVKEFHIMFSQLGWYPNPNPNLHVLIREVGPKE
ncbi:hypothetical protein [Phyllobacterium chamaecytisi]|uniref:hypothetical protein n=1 Tax=Phyllobacterium chamaecytisi TaxID=2876082 RepID=UPI001CC9FC56|nr:hypothetical protein [Phyllobacterium sp. KW56]MBZ9606113.1 hypothetical protein [Phyllobacterium sp. KW56]